MAAFQELHPQRYKTVELFSRPFQEVTCHSFDRLWTIEEVQRPQDSPAHSVQREQKPHRDCSLRVDQRTLGD